MACAHIYKLTSIRQAPGESEGQGSLVRQSMKSQRVRYNWATEQVSWLNNIFPEIFWFCTKNFLLNCIYKCFIFQLNFYMEKQQCNHLKISIYQLHWYVTENGMQIQINTMIYCFGHSKQVCTDVHAMWYTLYNLAHKHLTNHLKLEAKCSCVRILGLNHLIGWQ